MGLQLACIEKVFSLWSVLWTVLSWACPRPDHLLTITYWCHLAMAWTMLLLWRCLMPALVNAMNAFMSLSKAWPYIWYFTSGQCHGLCFREPVQSLTRHLIVHKWSVPWTVLLWACPKLEEKATQKNLRGPLTQLVNPEPMLDLKPEIATWQQDLDSLWKNKKHACRHQAGCSLPRQK